MRGKLYNQEYPKGLVFVTQEEYDEALSAGWVEAPWLVDEVKENAIEEGEKPEGDIIEHPGDDSGGTSTKTSGGGSIVKRKGGRPRKNVKR